MTEHRTYSTTISRSGPLAPIMRSVGDITTDDAGRLWYCTEAGTPGVWAEVTITPSTEPQPLFTPGSLTVNWPDSTDETDTGTGTAWKKREPSEFDEELEQMRKADGTGWSWSWPKDFPISAKFS